MLDSSLIPGLIHDFGYVGLAVGLVANCLGIPIASEILLPLTGVYAAAADLDIVIVIIVAVVSQVVGLSVAYYLAKNGGIELLEKYGRYVFLRHKDIKKFHSLFEKHGIGLIIIGSCIPGLHGYMGYTAGLAGMSVAVFAATAVFGTIVWTLALVGAGLIFKQQISSIISVLTGLGSITVCVLAVLIIGVWYAKYRKKFRHRKG